MNFLLDKLFIEKIQKLNKNSFLNLCTRSPKFSFPAIQDPFNWPKINSISSQSIDSFVLHFRFIIQNRDKISNKKTYERLLKEGLTNQSTDDLFSSWEEYKDKFIGAMFNGNKYTHCDLFNIVFYGGLAHHDQKYLLKFIDVARNPIGTGLALSSFKGCVKRIFAISKSLEKDIKIYIKQEKGKNKK